MQTSSPEQPAVRTKTTTVWLWIVIILNALVGLLSFTQIGTLADLGISPLFLIVSALLSLGVAVGTYMILQWKKMGFYIVVGCIVLNVLVSILGGSGFASIAGAVIGLGHGRGMEDHRGPEALHQLLGGAGIGQIDLHALDAGHGKGMGLVRAQDFPAGFARGQSQVGT